MCRTPTRSRRLIKPTAKKLASADDEVEAKKLASADDKDEEPLGDWSNSESIGSDSDVEVIEQ